MERVSASLALAEKRREDQDSLLSEFSDISRTILERAKTYLKFPAVKQLTADGHTTVMPAGTHEASVATKMGRDAFDLDYRDIQNRTGVCRSLRLCLLLTCDQCPGRKTG